MPFAKPADQTAIAQALSAPRMSTYLAAAGGDVALALELYGWNARISSALMVPAHFGEVVTRNAVSDALADLYGERWPWSPGFTASLPSPRTGYCPQHDLRATRARHATPGKVIAELKFAFWQSMFTARHDQRLWEPRIRSLFPNAGDGNPADLRFRIYQDLEAIRKLRNRIAHHEPIFVRDLADDLRKMLDLVQLRSRSAAEWVRAMEEVGELLAQRPVRSDGAVR